MQIFRRVRLLMLDFERNLREMVRAEAPPKATFTGAFKPNPRVTHTGFFFFLKENILLLLMLFCCLSKQHVLDGEN